MKRGQFYFTVCPQWGNEVIKVKITLEVNPYWMRVKLIASLKNSEGDLFEDQERHNFYYEVLAEDLKETAQQAKQMLKID
jgi:hypothetical protein